VDDYLSSWALQDSPHTIRASAPRCTAVVHHQRSELEARTVQPASAASGAYRFDMDPPALKSAMSTPLKLPSVSSSTVCCSPSQSMVLPADL
jgi:hypothetical protein